MFKGSVWGAQTNNPGKAFVFCPLRNPAKSPQWLIPAAHSENFLGWSRMALFASLALACALATYARFGLTSWRLAATLASIALFCLGTPLATLALTAVYGQRIAPESYPDLPRLPQGPFLTDYDRGKLWVAAFMMGGLILFAVALRIWPSLQ